MEEARRLVVVCSAKRRRLLCFGDGVICFVCCPSCRVKLRRGRATGSAARNHVTCTEMDGT